MNKEDKEILELYLKDRKKKKIIICFILIAIIISFCMYGFYMNYRQISKNITSQEKNESNIIETANTKDKEVPNVKNNINETKIENNLKEIQEENNIKNITKENQNDKVNNAQNKIVNKEIKRRPENKDFLFKDGYTMDNVTQKAQEYLKNSGFAGECIPLKDNEGVCVGMRVIFH